MFGKNRRSHSQPEEDNMLGLLPVNGCDNPHRRGDIIFVHGLAGHSWSTWHPQDNKVRQDANFWLSWLGEDLQHNGIDVGVWTFGYEAARFQFSGSAMARFDQASNLLEYLEVNDIGERPLIFVTHSMGGLLVKETIRTAQNFNKQAIIKQTKGIVFLSTPHTGSHLAKLIDNIGVLARPTVNVEELKAHAPELRSLNEWYRQNVDDLAIDTKVFYETKPTGGILVVDEDSANPGIKDVKPVAVPFDHNSITKPQKNNLVYLSVRKFVEQLLPSQLQLPPGKSNPLQQTIVENTKTADTVDNNVQNEYGGEAQQNNVSNNNAPLIRHFQKELFYELFLMSLNASWHTANYCFHDTIISQRNENKSSFHDGKFRLQGKSIELSEEILQAIQNGAWNAGWWAANTRAQEKRLPYYTRLEPNWIKVAQKEIVENFDKVRNSGKLQEELVDEIESMCKEMGWFTNKKVRGESNLMETYNLLERHCRNICPDIDTNQLRNDLGI